MSLSKNNHNFNYNLNFNLKLNNNLNLNVNVDHGHPWLTAHHDFASVDDRGYPWLQLIFVGLNATIRIICRGLLTIRGLAFLGLPSFSALGLLFTPFKELDPVAEESAVRKNFHALHFGLL